ncbi:MAG: ATP-binding protein [Maribacter sp.]
MKKLFPLCFLFLLFTILGFGQTKEIDSLKNELLKSSINDTTKISVLLTISEKYYSFSIDSLNLYSALALKLSKKSKNYRLGKAYRVVGVTNIFNGKNDSARYYLKKAIRIAEIKKDTSLQISAISNYASTLVDKFEFDESVQLYLKAMDLSKNNKLELGKLQFNLASNYVESGYDSLGINYFKLATKNAEESNSPLLLSYSLTSLAFKALESNKIELAKTYLDKSLVVCEKLNAPRSWSTYYLILGHYYDKMKMFDKAEIAYDRAISEAQQANYSHNIMYGYASLGEHFILVDKSKKAIENFKKFEKIYKIRPVPSVGVRAYEFWAKAENMLGNFKSSNKFLEKYISINDSINSEKNKTFIAHAETKYQTEKKDKEIAEQKLSLADQQLAITESKSKTRTMTILIVSLLLGSILLWFSFRQRQKRMQQQLVAIEREQEVRTLESLMEDEEKERFRIAKELHDGVNGDLSAIKFKLSSLLEMNNSVIKEAVAMIDNSCEQVRAISHNLVPPSLKDFNIVEAVEDYCQSMNSIHDPEVHFQQVGESINLDKKQEANIFRIIQELVTNSIKYAEAKEIHVQLSHLKNTLQLTVEDNGKGFDPKTVKSDGIGMRNVQSRVDYLNATMDFVSNEKGTSYTIEMDTKKKIS